MTQNCVLRDFQLQADLPGRFTLQIKEAGHAATRLFVAIMDEYEWNNNLGKFTVTASWLKP